MTPLRTTTLSDGRTLAWSEYGDDAGLPLLVLHGSPGGRLGWAHHAERFERQGLRVVAPERPGYGGSNPAPGRRVVDGAADLVAVLDHLGLDRVLVVGGSGGGPHALALAARAPERVRAVGALVSAAPLEAEDVELQVGINRAVLDAVDVPDDLRRMVEGVRDTLLGDGLAALMKDAPDSDRALWESQAEHLQRAMSSALAPGIEGLCDDYRAIFGLDWGFEPDEVKVPVLWAHGRDDKNVPLAAATRYAGRLPDCRFVTWSDVGHAVGPDLLAEFHTALAVRALGR